MRPLFEELDYRETPLGGLSLRRRRELRLDVDVLEIKLGDEFLMSSLFTISEVALAQLALADLPREHLAVAVGGLGLGYTAQAALEEPRVDSLLVVELLAPVIDWHRRGLLPLGPVLTRDARCRLIEGDFFALARSPTGLDPAQPGRRFDAILVDIDHSPEDWLDARSLEFYQPQGLSALAAQLHPGGVFAHWSNEHPDEAFTAQLTGIFASARAEPVTFYNPFQDRPFTQTVYIART